MRKLLFILASILTPLSCFAQTVSQCGPVLCGAKIFFAVECINDQTVMVVNSSKDNSSGWQYTYDGVADSTGGQSFEIYGLAIHETATEVDVVLNANMPEDGVPWGGTLNGNITYADLFLDLGHSDFPTASSNHTLFAVHFVDNDSDVTRIGVYKNVEAKSVTVANDGYTNLGQYESYVPNASFGDLTTDQMNAYYTLAGNLDEIAGAHDSYPGPDYAGPITFLSPADLSGLGFDLTQFSGSTTIAFKFQKNLIIDDCGVIGGDGSSCMDCAGVECGTTVKDQCGICGGNGTSCLGCDGGVNSGKTIDQCGVCGGDNSTCKDCAGIVNGSAKIDQCGVCGGDNSTCKDCKGIPNGTTTIDACGVCGGDGKSCAGCDGVPDSGKAIDACGVCGGDSSSCLDCAGVPNGGATVDQCGVCNGSNNTCLDCNGTPNGGAIVDACGICGGGTTDASQCVTTNSGCPAGQVLDRCGVCGGSNACLDCAGTPNGGAKVDCCGVCGGDGSSCIAQCKFYDLTKSKKQIRLAMNTFYKSVIKYSKEELACSNNKSRKARARILLAKTLRKQNLDIIGTFIKTKIKLCNTIFCAKTNLVSSRKSLKKNTKTLYKLSRASQYGAGAACNASIHNGRDDNGSTSTLGSANSAINQVPSESCNN